jgi:hypothetical protein
MSAFTEKNTLMGAAGVETSGDRGVAMAAETDSGQTDVIQYVEISTTGNSTDFGDLTGAHTYGGACSNGGSDRGIHGGGDSRVDIIDYITISSPGNATDFGDLTSGRINVVGLSNLKDDRGVFAGGRLSVGETDVIDYVTISSTGNATDFGDLPSTNKKDNGAFSNGTDDRGVIGGGWTGSTYSDAICYITITSTGNASDFGDLTVTRRSVQGVSNATGGRGVFAGGVNSSGTRVNTMDYVTIGSTGDATDFGDLSVARSLGGNTGASNGTNQRGLFFGGDTPSYSDVIDYITIDSAGNATDFGNLIAAGNGVAGCSNA